jgi:hypothetical protein
MAGDGSAPHYDSVGRASQEVRSYTTRVIPGNLTVWIVANMTMSIECLVEQVTTEWYAPELVRVDTNPSIKSGTKWQEQRHRQRPPPVTYAS